MSQKLLLMCMCVLVAMLTSFSYGDDWIDCGTPDSLTGGLATSVFSIDTAKVIHVFVIFPEDTISFGSDSLPTALVNYGDTADYGPAQILSRSSFGKLILNMDVNPGLDSNYFVLPHSREWYYNNCPDTMDEYPGHVKQMNQDVVDGLDLLINFGEYDTDNDGKVDYFAIDYNSLFINASWVGYARVHFPGTSLYATTDTNSLGNIVYIDGSASGHILRTQNIGRPWYDLSAGIWVHEMCHNVSVLGDYLHNWENNYSHGYQFHATSWGSQFTIDEDGRRRRSYFSPYWALKTGWLNEEDIDVIFQPIYCDTLNDYITTKDLVKVPLLSNEYFLISNRQNLLYNESHWPSKGLFVYHIENDASSQTYVSHKREDLEIADGLYVFNSDSTALIAAPDSGYDEIDFRTICGGDAELEELTGANAGDSGDAFVPPMDIVFDHTTNPNSNLYSSHNSKWYQDVPSHFSIRNLEADPSDTTRLIMDVLANHWYDSLTANTTWGVDSMETGYAITGDFIIPAACTLTIRKGTKIYFQAKEDDKASGSSSSRCELIVRGTLIAEGDSTNHIAFIPSSDQLGTAAPRDWYGVRFYPNSYGDLTYCDIKYANHGIAMADTAQVNLDHCTFTDCSMSGVYNLKGKLTATHCRFEDIGNYGIASANAESFVDSSHFVACKTYGVQVYYSPSYSLGTTIISNNDFRTGDQSTTIGSQYAIMVYANDDVRIENNTMRTYELGGIGLYETDCIVTGNKVTSSNNYGIYAYNSCNGLISYCDFDSLEYGIYLVNNSINTVKYCKFDSVYVGIRIQGNQQPDLGNYAGGDSTQWGNNNFEGCSYRYIQQYASYSPGPLITAEMNWFGPGLIDASKFTGNIDYTPPRGTNPRPKLSFENGLPLTYNLRGNYPNPFNPQTAISYSLAEPGYATLDVYNILGQRIVTLVDEYREAGNHTVIWDGTNEAGEPVASGVYLYRLQSGNYSDSKKMLLLR